MKTIYVGRLGGAFYWKKTHIIVCATVNKQAVMSQHHGLEAT